MVPKAKTKDKLVGVTTSNTLQKSLVWYKRRTDRIPVIGEESEDDMANHRVPSQDRETKLRPAIEIISRILDSSIAVAFFLILVFGAAKLLPVLWALVGAGHPPVQ